MTAEIAIMNKLAVALAADSAVTISRGDGQKIYNSVNKLFALSKRQPIGVMVFGNAELMGVPWETIIKHYRSELGGNELPTVEHYVNHFVSFLSAPNPLFPDAVQSLFAKRVANGFFQQVRGEVDKDVRARFEQGPVTIEAVQKVVDETATTHLERLVQREYLPGGSEVQDSEILEKYGASFNAALAEVFENLVVPESTAEKLRRCAAYLLTKDVFSPNYSGIVIAGFGKDEFFPSLLGIQIEGIANNRLKFKQIVTRKITIENDASITPFAQNDMVIRFMEGVDKSYNQAVENFLSEILKKEYPGALAAELGRTDEERMALQKKMSAMGQALHDEYLREMQNLRRVNFVKPIVRAVAVLPKDELAAMAESLVNLTSFKRKMSLDAETVGGPIDVAVISKGDGFIWIKRKHYFKPELNPQFIARYYLEGEMGDD